MVELIQVLSDSAIATLPMVLDPAELIKSLKPVLPAEWGKVRQVQINVLTHRPGHRCTVAIALRTADGDHELIGKVYAEDRSGTYEAMEELKRAGFGREAEFSIPEPLVYLSSLNLLLQEKVEGEPAEKIFLRDSERVRAAERCGRWLARFHETASPSGPVFRLADYLSILERWSGRIVRLGEPIASKAAQVFRGLEAAAPSPGTVANCGGHGDYEPTQIIFACRRTVTLDWDEYGLADPSRDVARFIVALRRLAWNRLGAIGALDGAAEAFLLTYTANGRSDATARLPFYMAAVWLEAAKNAAKKQASGLDKRIEGMLDEGLRTLGQEAMQR